MNEKIPARWSIYPLKDICYFQEGPGLRNWQYKKTGIKFLNIRCIKDGKVDLSIAQSVAKEEVNNKYKHFLLDPNDYVLSSSGTLGRLAKIDASNLPLLLNTSIIRFRSSNENVLDHLFLRYFLQSKYFFDKISEQSQGSAQANVGPTHLKLLNVALPTLPEQKKIASILSSVDDVIEKIQLQINKHQDLKTSVMNELLTKGIGHTDFKDSELGRIPKSWKITELSKVSMILSSNVDKKTIENETLVSLCNYMDVYKNLIITREINFMKASAKKSEINKFLIKKDDVIITKDSETPDDIAISSYVSEDFDNVLCGYHLSIIRSNKSVVDGKFLSLFFKLDYTRHRFSILANGTTRFGLNLKEIENSKILVPSLEEQKKIANIIFSLDDEISTITKKFNKYIFLKKSLMQDLLTGKVRVSVN